MRPLLECPRHYDPLATHLLERATNDDLRELVRFYRLRMGEWQPLKAQATERGLGKASASGGLG